LLDIKHIESSMHEIITGRENEKVLKFANYLNTIGKPMWLRYVLVPGLTDQHEHLHALGRYFEGYENIEKIEIQPYHELGKHKWGHMGKKYPLEGTPLNTSEQLKSAKEIFEQYFKEVVVN
jgi:pyruvate formate lyase activating enzyme